MTLEVGDLTQFLAHVADETQPIRFSELYNLSDLHGDELLQFSKTWEGLSTRRRRQLVQGLSNLGETSFEVSFDAIFRRLWDDPDDLVRAAAINGLWENESPSLVGPMLTALRSDPAPSVRAAAASGLGRFVLAGELEDLDPAIQARIVTELLAVLRLTGEADEVRRRALESVAYACTLEVLEALSAAYDEGDVDMRMSAVLGMGRSCDRRWQPIVLEELESPLPAMRYEAALACGELELAAAVPMLALLLHDPDREICEAAIWALGQIGGKRAKGVLLDAYCDADEDTQSALDDALAEVALLEGDLDLDLYEVTEQDEESFIEEDFGDWEDEDDDVDEADDLRGWHEAEDDDIPYWDDDENTEDDDRESA